MSGGDLILVHSDSLLEQRRSAGFTVSAIARRSASLASFMPRGPSCFAGSGGARTDEMPRLGVLAPPPLDRRVVLLG
jgi:hypothetical protein